LRGLDETVLFFIAARGRAVSLANRCLNFSRNLPRVIAANATQSANNIVHNPPGCLYDEIGALYEFFRRRYPTNRVRIIEHDEELKPFLEKFSRRH